jgi:hypothetical protein
VECTQDSVLPNWTENNNRANSVDRFYQATAYRQFRCAVARRSKNELCELATAQDLVILTANFEAEQPVKEADSASVVCRLVNRKMKVEMILHPCGDKKHDLRIRKIARSRGCTIP